MRNNTEYAIASAACACFATGLMLKIDRTLLVDWLGISGQWLSYVALIDHALIVLGGFLLMLHWFVKTPIIKGTQHEKS